MALWETTGSLHSHNESNHPPPSCHIEEARPRRQPRQMRRGVSQRLDEKKDKCLQILEMSVVLSFTL